MIRGSAPEYSDAPQSELSQSLSLIEHPAQPAPQDHGLSFLKVCRTPNVYFHGVRIWQGYWVPTADSFRPPVASPYSYPAPPLPPYYYYQQPYFLNPPLESVNVHNMNGLQWSTNNVYTEEYPGLFKEHYRSDSIETNGTRSTALLTAAQSFDSQNYDKKSDSLACNSIIKNVFMFDNTDFSSQKVRLVVDQYFYQFDNMNFCEIFSDEELKVIKIFLIKKLVHDKKKSKVLHQIANLTSDMILQFMVHNPPLNRKNIIKSNVFKKIWKIMEKRHKQDFHVYYFGKLSENQPPEMFSMKIYRRNHNFNLGDDFYSRCFTSEQFCEDFFAILQDLDFKNSTLKASQANFLKFFEGWIKEIRRFLAVEKRPFDISTKLPELKFGISMNDFDLSRSLFAKLSQKKDAVDATFPCSWPAQDNEIF